MNWTERDPSQHPDVPHPEILRCVVGSSVHGLALAGKDDRDEMGVCVESLDAGFGLRGTFEQFIYRSAAVREKRHDAPSQPGDLDLTVYSLRKWARLALDGNPTVLLLLFAPVTHSTVAGVDLRALAPYFASRRAGKRFLGYLQAQRQRLLGERGQKNVNRRALVEEHGYDTKYAGHMLRLGYQGVEYMETGALELPMREDLRQRIIDVREGKVSIQDVLTETGEVEVTLRDSLMTSPLNEEPDAGVIEEFVLDTYLCYWNP